MAEGDRFERAFGAGWRTTYRRAREGMAPPSEVSDKLMTALAKTLRERGGIPGFGEMQKVVENAVWRLAFQSSGVGEEAAILLESLNMLDRIVREYDGHRHAKVAAEVAKAVLVQQGAPAKGNSIWPVPFAEKTCMAIVEHYFFATARLNLVAEGKLGSHGQAREWQRGVEEAMKPAIRQMGERVARDHNAKALRAPNRSVKPQPTGDLLKEVVSSDMQGSSLGGTRR